ncbi:MAG: hypothetical protein HN390_10445 [Anaerolineae bacterium]|jgi:hypothetical protein|nr:hypothetical protein [Anaerolineae bacterium]MBT7189628.1 hypothetical protein [Anaerolineae bacterium]MBT7991844.1 hypothetical protein [Anaerolineae bacterium]
MSPKIKDIGFGLSVGLGISFLLFFGIVLLAEFVSLADFQSASAQEILSTPQNIASATPAPSILPTPPSPPFPETGPLPLQPRPSAAPPTPTLNTEQLVLGNPLDEEEQARLHAASLAFVAPDFYSSKAIGEAINGEGYGHPSNICGPLAIAILQEGAILSNQTAPYEFWLLNPDVAEDLIKLKSVFAESRFESKRDNTALNKVDWKNSPLMPGDFLYLFSGSRGNFEHMLAVTRVDEDGRAYTVTNHNTEENGFIITEELLYDPNNPGEGLFYEWTERQKSLLGSTGFDGYQLWRLREK